MIKGMIENAAQLRRLEQTAKNLPALLAAKKAKKEEQRLRAQFKNKGALVAPTVHEAPQNGENKKVAKAAKKARQAAAQKNNGWFGRED
jgi:hypothetical protein